VLKKPFRDIKITIKKSVILMDDLIYILQLLRRKVFAQYYNIKIIKY
jgi:hypothetical protein